MKRVLFLMVIATMLSSLCLISCRKDAASAIVTGHPTPTPLTIDLVASQWRLNPGGIFSVAFPNVVPLNYASSSAKIYLVGSDKIDLINQPIPFRNGELWATYSQTDVSVNYRGEPKNLTYVTIRVVIE